MQQAQAHCRDLQERYRQLVAEGTALKADKFSLEKQLVREGEERARWEKELAESQVAVLLVEKDIEARTCCLQGLKDEREACTRIRIHLAALDLKCNEQNSAHWNFILNLPDSFYNGAALKHKVELQSLKHQLADATEQEEQRIALERRLSASINDNEQLSSMLQKTEQAILEAEQKMKDAEAEQDCMAFMREEALATKRSELDRVYVVFWIEAVNAQFLRLHFEADLRWLCLSGLEI